MEIKFIGRNIGILRKKMKLTQEQLAEKIESNPNYISFLETGTKTPSLAMIDKIRIALCAKWSDIFNESAEAFSEENPEWTQSALNNKKILDAFKNLDQNKIDAVLNVVHFLKKEENK